jgi:hypothetical protein
MPVVLIFKNRKFCSQNAFIGPVWFSELTAVIQLTALTEWYWYRGRSTFREVAKVYLLFRLI